MTNIFDVFEQDKHLIPTIPKATFESLDGWDFGWAILEPINIADTKEDEIELAKRLSPGQKALYFFWYLDAQVTNGGFIQFYWNDYRYYLPTIKEGLKLVGDEELLSLVDKADEYYLQSKDLFDENQKLDDWEPLYDNLVLFDEYDDAYFEIHNKTIDLIEEYIRENPSEFVTLTD